MDENSELRSELKRDFREFLEQDFGFETGQGKYAKQIEEILKQYTTTKRMRLEVDLQGEKTLASIWIFNPFHRCDHT